MIALRKYPFLQKHRKGELIGEKVQKGSLYEHIMGGGWVLGVSIICFKLGAVEQANRFDENLKQKVMGI